MIVKRRAAFTLLEMSIVLVIIGLLVGGIFVGKDLIKVAEQRGAISQLDYFNAVATRFKDKYGSLPGDGKMSRFPQFATRSGAIDHGDNDGKIDHNPWVPTNGPYQCSESLLFWGDLEREGFISDTTGVATDATSQTTCVPATLYPDSGLADYLPRGKLANTFVVMVSFPGQLPAAGIPLPNSFMITGINNLTNMGQIISQYTIDPSMAYGIDVKLDDGLPNTGSVVAVFSSYDISLDTGGAKPYFGGTTGCTSSGSYNFNNATSNGCALIVKSRIW